MRKHPCARPCVLFDFPINPLTSALDAVARGQRVLGVMQSNCGAYAAATLHPVGRHDA